MKVTRLVDGEGKVFWLVERPLNGVRPHVLLADSEVDLLLDEVGRQRAGADTAPAGINGIERQRVGGDD